MNAEQRKVRRMLNSVAVVGRLTSDPELRTTATGTNVTTFTLAVNRDYVKKGEQRQADFLDCVAWSNTAELICRYMKKGNQIAVSGSIQTRSFEDKEGKKRKITEILVNSVTFLPPYEAKKEDDVPLVEIADEDLPFD